jgi:hypothetical protein
MVATLVVAHPFKGVAQQIQPELLITWQASSYAPPGFRGKILPTIYSSVAASVELIDNGKIVDISNQPIYWYLDGDLIQNTTGVQRVVFPVNAFPGNTLALRVELPNYQGQSILKTAEIPTTKPAVVIDAPFPEKRVASTAVQVAARAFFFNVRSLNALVFDWSVNGTTAANSENPDLLVINLPSQTVVGYPLNLSVTASDPSGGPLATADDSVSLLFSQK